MELGTWYCCEYLLCLVAKSHARRVRLTWCPCSACKVLELTTNLLSDEYVYAVMMRSLSVPPEGFINEAFGLSMLACLI